MKKTIMVLMLLCIALSAAAYASYDIDWTFTSSKAFNARKYVCTTTVCQEAALTNKQDVSSTLLNGKQAAKLDFTGSGTFSNRDRYAIFLYPKNDCLLPNAMQYSLPTWNYDYPGTVTWTSDLDQAGYFEKQDADFCGSNIDQETIKANNVLLTCTKIAENLLTVTYDCGEVTQGAVLKISTRLQGGWNLTGIPNTADYHNITFIPDDLNSNFDTTIDVNFSVNGVQKNTEQITMPWYPQYVTRNFEHTVSSPGTYALRVATTMENECKCAPRADGTRSNYKFVEFRVTVPPPAPYCGDSLCNDGNSKTCEPDGGSKDMKCANNVYTGDLSNGVCRTEGTYACTYCGDGIKQSGAGEECDGTDGVGQNQECNSECKLVNLPYCGDSLCNDGAGATCDPNGGTKDIKCSNEVFTGDLADGVCRPSGTYKCTYCGDGVKQSGAGEECDDGNNNNDDGCSAECKNEDLPRCGDSLCNDGSSKTCEPNGPSYDFTCPAYGTISEGTCRTDGDYACTYCGDNILQTGAGEKCEPPGTDNSPSCAQTTETCKDNKWGFRDSFGDCDASCGCLKDKFTYTCVKDKCGATCTQDSDCDDGNPNTIDSCNPDSCGCSHITQPYCGDSLCNDGAGKTCEPNGATYDLTCPAASRITDGVCRTEGTFACTYCGDNNVQLGAGEECDDGNTNNNDGCSAECKTENVIPEFSSPLVPLALLAGIAALIYRRK